MCTRLGLNQLQSRTNGISGGVGSAAQQSVSLAHLYQHGAEVVALCQICLDGIHVHLALAQLKHLLCHLIEFSVVCRINDGSLLDVKTALCSSSLYFVNAADEDNVHQVILEQTSSCLQNTSVRTLCENDSSALFLQSSNQILKHWFSLQK